MSKKRKTMKQKLKPSEKNEFQISFQKIALQTISQKQIKNSIPKSTEHASTSYTYVLTDSRKTLFVVSALFCLNIIFFIFWKTNMIRLSFLGL